MAEPPEKVSTLTHLCRQERKLRRCCIAAQFCMYGSNFRSFVSSFCPFVCYTNAALVRTRRSCIPTTTQKRKHKRKRERTGTEQNNRTETEQRQNRDRTEQNRDRTETEQRQHRHSTDTARTQHRHSTDSTETHVISYCAFLYASVVLLFGCFCVLLFFCK